MRPLVVTIPGPPVAFARMRLAVRSRRHFEPANQRAWKASARKRFSVLKRSASLAPGRLWPLDVPLAVSLLFAFECPKSHRRKRRPPGRRPYTATPDLDNLVKLALDAGNGIVWHDDRLICEVSARKIYAAQGEEPRTVFLIKELEADDWVHDGDVAGYEEPEPTFGPVEIAMHTDAPLDPLRATIEAELAVGDEIGSDALRQLRGAE